MLSLPFCYPDPLAHLSILICETERERERERLAVSVSLAVTSLARLLPSDAFLEYRAPEGKIARDSLLPFPPSLHKL